MTIALAPPVSRNPRRIHVYASVGRRWNVPETSFLLTIEDFENAAIHIQICNYSGVFVFLTTIQFLCRPTEFLWPLRIYATQCILSIFFEPFKDIETMSK